jgi:hypothetical protein
VPTLKEVKLEHNAFSGAIPEAWAPLRDLRVLRLEFNRLSGARSVAWDVEGGAGKQLPARPMRLAPDRPAAAVA